MLAAKDIVWSEEKLSLIDLFHSAGSSQYPLLIKVVQGHYAKTTEENYDPEETFVLHGWGRQERVLAENADKVPISIPTSHEHKLSVYAYTAEKGKHKVSLPLSRILSLSHPPIRAEFDPGRTSVFNVGGTVFNSKDFGPMLLKSSHLLEYAKCSPISREVSFYEAGTDKMESVHALPTSLSLTCVVAIDLCNGLDLDTILKRLQEEYATLMDLTMDHKLVGICGYSDLVPQKDEQYEFIQDIPAGPWGSRLGFKSSNSDRKTKSLVTQSQGDYLTIIPPTLRGNLSQSSDCHEYTSLAIAKTEQTQEDPCLIRQPKKPTRMQPAVSEAVALNAKGLGRDRNIMHGDFMKELEGKLSRKKSDNSLTMPFKEMPLDRVPVPPPINVSGPLHPPIPPIPPRHLAPTSTPTKGSTSIPSTMAHGSVSSITPARSVRRINSLEDVPDDISSLSVQDVCDCLRLLKLDSHVQKFSGFMVDGALLLACTTEDLQTEFGLTSFRARQVERFVKEGWRPKLDG